MRIHAADYPDDFATVELPRGRERGFSDFEDDAAYSPTGRWLACTTDSCTILVVDTFPLTVTQELVAHTNIITDLEWLGPDVVASASADGTVRIWDATDGRQLRVVEAGQDVLGLTYLPAGDAVLAWTRSSYLWWSGADDDLLEEGPHTAR